MRTFMPRTIVAPSRNYLEERNFCVRKHQSKKKFSPTYTGSNLYWLTNLGDPRQRVKHRQKTPHNRGADFSFSDHLIGEGLGKPEMTGFAISCVHRCAPR